MIHRLPKIKFLALLGALFLSLNLSAEPSSDEGKGLFRNNCATCHNKNMKDDMTGPALGAVEERWADYPQEDLYKWIRNSQGLIQEGHPRANELWNEWGSVMTAFPNLTDEQVASILLYINCMYDGSCDPAAAAVVGTIPTDGGEPEDQGSNTLLYITLFLILTILSVVLARIISNLNHMIKVKDGATNIQRRSLVEMLTSKGVIAFVIFALVVLGGYTTVNNAINLGRQQGYAPEQPIKFSHATHAGLQKIDCQYCHDGARRSKHSVIPAVNTFMNCHKAVKVGSKYGTAELSKIYAAAGYNPNTDKYIENYDDLTEEEIEDIFKTWIGKTYIKENELNELDNEGEKAVEDQWEGIVKSLTNEQKTKIQGPVEWVRIHNLPDHAYFNHAQHVSVGKVECQQCHGPVEKMEIVAQYSPLSMGWCINCHRQTEVKFTDNEYYQSYEKYHEELKDGTRKKVTVEDIGGLECQKCHY